MVFKINFYKFGLNDSETNTKFGGMYGSFFDSLNNLGCQVDCIGEGADKEADLLVVQMGGGQDQDSAKAMQRFEGPVVLYVPPAILWFRKSFLKRWKNKILFVYGWDRSDFSTQKYANLGISYYHIPAGSNPDIMKPLNLPKIYDIIFVATANSGQGRHKYIDHLIKATKSRKVLIIGPGWEKYGYPKQIIAWGDLLNIL